MSDSNNNNNNNNNNNDDVIKKKIIDLLVDKLDIIEVDFENAEAEGHEIGRTICKDENGDISLSDPVGGKKESVEVPKCNFKRIASVHTHFGEGLPEGKYKIKQGDLSEIDILVHINEGDILSCTASGDGLTCYELNDNLYTDILKMIMKIWDIFYAKHAALDFMDTIRTFYRSKLKKDDPFVNEVLNIKWGNNNHKHLK